MKTPRFWLALTTWRAAVVQTREQLEAALARAPRHIVVEGTEALRAYAATLAYRGGAEAAAMEGAPPPASAASGYLQVPTIGRIRDGYRQRRTAPSRSANQRRWLRVMPGIGPLLVAGLGLVAALLVEWLSFAGSTELVRRVHHTAPPPRRGVHVKLPTHAPVQPRNVLLQIAIPVLVALAVAALAYVVWQAIGPGREVRVSWRVAHRVQGRLVIARVRTRIA
jgi:hypothetical protein